MICTEIEQLSSVEIAVVVVSSLDGEIFSVAQELFGRGQREFNLVIPS